MAKNKRVYPSLLSRSYVHLTKLRDNYLYFFSKYIFSNKKAVLLDFGCGDMPYKELLAPHVEKYIGLDLHINPVADVWFDHDSKTTLPDGIADVLLSTQVLEHVDSVESYLTEACRLLNEQGIMMLSTHGFWVYHPTPGDYWRWTSMGLKRTVERYGFEVIDFKGVMGVASSGIQLFQDGLLGHIKNKYVYGGISLFFQLCILLVEKFSKQDHTNIDASLYILVARKKKCT